MADCTFRTQRSLKEVNYFICVCINEDIVINKTYDIFNIYTYIHIYICIHICRYIETETIETLPQQASTTVLFWKILIIKPRT